MKKKPKQHPFKRTNVILTLAELTASIQRLQANGYPISKWIEFSRELIEQGYLVRLYEARQTASKYLTITRPGSNRPPFKVRFSNHKPNRGRELGRDCDFFVGVTHLGVTNTEQAKRAVRGHFQGELYGVLARPDELAR